MKLGCIQNGHARIGRTDQEHDLGASQDDGLRAALGEPVHGCTVVFARGVLDFSGAKLLVNDPMELQTLIALRNEYAQRVALLEPLPIEILFHGEARPQESDRGCAEPGGRRAGGIGNVQQRHRGTGLDLRRYFVHGIGTEYETLRPGFLEPPGRLRQQLPRLLPAVLMLQSLDRAEVHAIKHELGGTQRPQAGADRFVDDAVIMYGRFPAHAADQADRSHYTLSSETAFLT